MWSEIGVPTGLGDVGAGGDGVQKDSVGMFTFDKRGLLVELRNLQRIKGEVGG